MPVNVLPGSAAAAAGLQDGDIITALDGAAVRSFASDLQIPIARKTLREPFMLTVRRGERTLDLKGVLGGEQVAPIAVAQGALLVWPVLPWMGRGTPGQMQPEGTWVAVLDLATGQERWRRMVPPATRAMTPPRPLLVPTPSGPLALFAEDEELVALSAAANQAEQAVWRVPGEGRLLSAAQVVSFTDLEGETTALWLPDPVAGSAVLRRVRDGRTLVRVDQGGATAPILEGSDLLVADPDGGVAAYDLAYATRRWRSSEVTRVLAMVGDLVVALPRDGRLVVLDRSSGNLRRNLGGLVPLERQVVSGDRLIIQVQLADQRQALVALTLPGAAEAWMAPLPGAPSRMIADPANPGGVVLTFADPAIASVVRLDREGHLVDVVDLLADVRVETPVAANRQGAETIVVGTEAFPVPGGAVVVRADGMVRRNALVPGRSAPVTVEELPMDREPKSWRSLPQGGAWAATSFQGNLVIWLERPLASTAVMDVRIGQRSGVLDDGSLRLRWVGDEEVRREDGQPTGQGWSYVGWNPKPAGSPAAGRRRVCLLLAPPANRRAGLPPLIRVSCDGLAAPASEGAFPWFLRSTWTPLSGAP